MPSAEMMVEAGNKMADSQMTAQYLISELRCSHTAQVRRKGNDHKMTNACSAEEIDALFNIGKKAQVCRITRQNDAGMRIKGDCDSV
jgi:hypothetical protein